MIFERHSELKISQKKFLRYEVLVSFDSMEMREYQKQSFPQA